MTKRLVSVGTQEEMLRVVKMIETMQKKLSGFGANWHCLNSKHNNRRAPTTHAHTLSPHKQQKTRGIYISTYNTTHLEKREQKQTHLILKYLSTLNYTHWFSHFQHSKGKKKSQDVVDFGPCMQRRSHARTRCP